ncbi:hypothetical protein GW17_00007506 [Ensete ventricosum]|nr:hypothetical protein GW17_00007506 [Ensete ventricosum]
MVQYLVPSDTHSVYQRRLVPAREGGAAPHPHARRRGIASLPRSYAERRMVLPGSERSAYRYPIGPGTDRKGEPWF